MRLSIITICIVSCGLTACVNLTPRQDTTTSYVLGPIDLPVASQAAPLLEAVYIARPQLPVYMEGYGLKVRAADGVISQLPAVRWAESIDFGIARTLSHYIEAQNSRIKAGFYPWPQTATTTKTLHVHFHQLVATADGRIQLSASWEWKHALPGAAPAVGRFKQIEGEWLPGDAQSMVAGLNTALNVLAIEIGNSLKKDRISPKDY